MLRLLRNIGSILFIVIFSTLVLLSNKSFAEEGFTVTPVRSEFDIYPGTQKNGSIRVGNKTNDVMTIGLSAEAFSVKNQQYDYIFDADSDVAKWIIFNKPAVSIEPGELIDIPFSIGVPLSAEPGGRYVGIFISNDTVNDDEGIVARQRVVSLLYITVNGEVTRNGELISLNTPWLITDENNWSMTIRNSGSAHFRSRFNTTMTNLLGDVVGGDIIDESMILPGTVKLVGSKGQMPTWPGVYKVNYTIGLGDKPAVVEKRYVLYLPQWSIALILVLIGIMAFVRYRRKKNQSVCGTAV